MDLQHPSTAAPASQQAAVEASTTASADKHQSGSEVGTRTRLHGVWLLLARGGWLAAMALAVVILIAAVPVRFSKLLNFLSIFIIDTSTTRAGDLDPHAVQNGLQQLGISPGFYAAYNVALELIMVLGFLVVGTIIFLRKSNDLMAIAVSFTLITFGPALSFTANTLVAAQPEWRLAVNSLSIGWTTFGLIFLGLFPDGKFEPRWMRLWAILWIAYSSAYFIIPDNSPINANNWPIEIIIAATIGVLGIGVYAQVYRYRRVSGPARRHQTKWVVFGMAMLVAGIFAQFVPYVVLQDSGLPNSTRMLYDLIIAPITNLLILCLPLTVAFSVLRYRLYDIDVIVNRTLVYVPLTAILAGLYSASIALLQKLFVAATGEKSDAAIVITTLLLTTTFTPIKNLLQSAVDKRFKETRDATKKLKSFDQQVRSVGDVLDTRQLSRRLLDETTTAFNAKSGAVYLMQNGALEVVHLLPGWDGNVGNGALTVPLESEGEQVGLLKLGARRDGMVYSKEDQQMLRQAAEGVAHIVHLAERAR